ncbi:hypothetical protein GGR56DRAFT_670200 [Xylariaceae sp. FL0804]|nr:hypothetical protein GGR56DRAFT_670200 [Xylariaceae sp. FL0804]
MTAQDWQDGAGRSPTADPAARPSAAPTASTQQRQRNDESWVEVSSQPSSSSVSSIGDEIVTTGLQVGSSYGARRRRLHPRYYTHLHQQPSPAAGPTGSQDEYDETESESDHMLASSAENASFHEVSRSSTPLRQVTQAQAQPPARPLPQDDSSVEEEEEDDDDDDDDENATALGTYRRRPSEPFRPQPNAFSHPPSHLTHRHSASSAVPTHSTRPSFNQRSQTRVDRRTPNLMSPTYQADNDAALRASLTTLLSCAAAARGLSSRDGDKEKAERVPPAAAGSQPVELRLVPESELMAPTSAAPAQARSSRVGSSSPPSREASAAGRSGDKNKRAAAAPAAGGPKSPRATKKKKTAAGSEDTVVSPTLLTWVVSAGVVVLVSVVGFGAGYVIGREVGRQEALSSLGGAAAAGNTTSMVVADGGSCGREVIRNSGGSLRRFQWGTGMGRSVAA